MPRALQLAQQIVQTRVTEHRFFSTILAAELRGKTLSSKVFKRGA